MKLNAYAMRYGYLASYHSKHNLEHQSVHICLDASHASLAGTETLALSTTLSLLLLRTITLRV